MEGIKITQVEQQSSTWKKIENHLEERLQDLREQNDNDLTEIETQKIRGSIAEVKRILELREDETVYELPRSDGELLTDYRGQ